MKLKLKDPWSAITHGIAVLLAAAGAAPLLIKAARSSDMLHIFALAVFILTMILLYTASTIYHSVDSTEKVNRRLRKADHMMIFIMIAGSYTPVCLSLIQGTEGLIILIIEWTMVLAGILLKAIAKRSYPILSMVIYMVMGWCAIFFLPDLLARAQPLFLVFIVLGGLMYTAGAFFYAQPKHAYFHFIWHLFINLASIFHFIALIFFL